MWGGGSYCLSHQNNIHRAEAILLVQERAWASRAWTILPLTVSVLKRSKMDLAQPRGRHFCVTSETIWPKQVDRRRLEQGLMPLTLWVWASRDIWPTG